MKYGNVLVLTLILGLGTMSVFSADETGKTSEIGKIEQMEETRRQLVEKGVEFLRSTQEENGSFSVSPRSGIGPTAVIVAGMLQNGYPMTDPMVEKSLVWLLQFTQDDGGIYAPPGRIKNYETCMMILVLTEANKVNKDGRYDEVLKNAETMIRGEQFDELDGYSRMDPYYGGIGYGNNTRPDLSNTQFMLEALHALGNGPDDPAIQKALVFVSRCQNLESEHNQAPIVSEDPDGGFFYTNAGLGESPAGRSAAGGLRSYGSMTYAGLKSMIFAGLTASDPRVKAAAGWLKENYTLEENPGLGKRGLYYYYQTMGNALTALGSEVFISEDGNEHRWKLDLIKTLAEKQRPDGSWVNSDPMWMENDPNLVTGFALMVLADCKPESEQ